MRWITSVSTSAARFALDVGSSTGGFTDCLLQRGSARVWAIDVGHGQLDWKLRNDPRVVVREGVNARYLQRKTFRRSSIWRFAMPASSPPHCYSCDRRC